MAQKKQKLKKQSATTKKDDKIVLNMTFHEAMKKALNTPLPKKSK